MGSHQAHKMKFMFKVYIALFLAVTIVDAAPFNAVGPFYNGNAASAPSFDIQEHLWPGLTVKSFSLGGR